MAQIDLRRKLSVLADAAKYDASCASSGTSQGDSSNGKGIGSTEGMGICHAYTPDDRCVSLLKILLTNFCIYDCAYCNVLKGVNPQGVRVQSFKAPSKQELAHDFLWRIHKVVPARGMIGVFNRSHYEDVLVVRVHNLVPEAVWRPRYAQINQFEKLLHDSGTRILKFYLHISAAEQKERFQARLDDPEKHWKFSLEDLEKRKFWPDYMAAYEEMLRECSTEWAPWYVVPANQKWYRNLAIMRTIVHTLRDMNPQFPEAEDNFDGVVIE